MKIFWSLAALKPLDVVARPLPDTEDAYTPSYEAASRVLEVAKIAADLRSTDRILFHADTLRATTVILQLLLRKTTMERAQLERFVLSCRAGIATCRSLVPKVLSRAEDKFEALINQYVALGQFL